MCPLLVVLGLVLVARWFGRLPCSVSLELFPCILIFFLAGGFCHGLLWLFFLTAHVAWVFLCLY